MLLSDERECVTKYLGYVAREFWVVCRSYGCDPHRIKNKLEKHKAANYKSRAMPLTTREQAVLSGFLRENITEFGCWLKTYNLNEKQFFNAIKSMVAGTSK